MPGQFPVIVIDLHGIGRQQFRLLRRIKPRFPPGLPEIAIGIDADEATGMNVGSGAEAVRVKKGIAVDFLQGNVVVVPLVPGHDSRVEDEFPTVGLNDFLQLADEGEPAFRPPIEPSIPAMGFQPGVSFAGVGDVRRYYTTGLPTKLGHIPGAVSHVRGRSVSPGIHSADRCIEAKRGDHVAPGCGCFENGAERIFDDTLHLGSEYVRDRSLAAEAQLFTGAGLQNVFLVRLEEPVVRVQVHHSRNHGHPRRPRRRQQFGEDVEVIRLRETRGFEIGFFAQLECPEFKAVEPEVAVVFHEPPEGPGPHVDACVRKAVSFEHAADLRIE